MRFAFVTPRYGTEVIGGAELGARMLAERLVDRVGWEVEVFTTCALDATTWADHYPPGTTIVEGVRVHRFPVTGRRHRRFDALSRSVLADPTSTERADALRWIDRQGPVSPALVDALAPSDCDVIAFYPYLYHPTVHGVTRVRDRAIMHPAAHDEPALRLAPVLDAIEACRGLVFQTEGERALVESLLPSVVARPQVVVGLGVDEPPETIGMPMVEGPYLLCLGRVDRGKGTDLLVELFAAFKERRPGPLRLVLAGPVVHQPRSHPDVIVTGPVSEQDKWALLHGATVFVHPSSYEAFSIVVIEAMTCARPVVVNAACVATREHCERSGAGLWFGGYAGFEVTLDRLLGDADLCDAMGRAGLRYAASYRWPVVIDRYAAFVESVAYAARQ